MDRPARPRPPLVAERERREPKDVAAGAWTSAQLCPPAFGGRQALVRAPATPRVIPGEPRTELSQPGAEPLAGTGNRALDSGRCAKEAQGQRQRGAMEAPGRRLANGKTW
jgi:hypothetical protein